jgi:putative flippase GtrA
MYLLTSILGINYIISGALAGAFVTILQFIPTEFWIFKGKKKKMVVL